MKLRIIAVMLAALTVILSSCGIITINHGNGGDDTTDSGNGNGNTSSVETHYIPDGEEASKKRLDELASYDFGGTSIIVASVKETGDIFNDEEGIYSSAVYARNNMVADKYNCSVIPQYKSEQAILSDLKISELSRMYYADIAIVRSQELGTWYMKSHLRNLNAVSHIDLSAEYYNSYATKQLSPNSATYAAVGDAVDDMEKYACFYINKKMLEDSGVQLDYSKISQGKFMWEDLLEMAKKTPDGMYQITSALSDELTAEMCFFSGGQNFMSQDGNGKFRLSCLNETTDSLTEFVKKMFDTKTDKAQVIRTIKKENGDISSEKVKLGGIDLFANGDVMFCLGTVGDMSKVTDCGFAWDVLPLPKVNEDSKYSTGVTGDAPVMAVLTDAQDIDTIGYIFQALNAASCNYVRYEFYKTAMMDYISGVHTPDMLDFIAQNPVYDMAVMFSTASSAVKNSTVTAYLNAVKGKNGVSSYFENNISALNKYVDSLD